MLPGREAKEGEGEGLGMSASSKCLGGQKLPCHNTTNRGGGGRRGKVP